MCHTMYIPYVITHTGLLNIKESNIKNPVNSVIFANGKIILPLMVEQKLAKIDR